MHHSEPPRSMYIRDVRIASSVLLTLLCSNSTWSEAAAPDKATTPIRLVSFAPSCSELIESLKAGNCLVGVCKFCEITHGERVQRVGDFTMANMEKLAQLKPDAILTVNGQETLTHSLIKNGFKVITFSNSRMSDISHNLIEIGTLTKHSDSARILAKNFEESVSELRILCAKGKRSTVFLCIWPQPLLTAGSTSFLNEAVAICGGNNIAASLKEPYPSFSQERLVIANPEVLIMPAEAQTATYLKRAPWNELRASKENRVYFLDKGISDKLNRPSIEVVDGLYWLASKLHPELAKDLSAWQAKTHSRFKYVQANKHF
jgi:iron complex transport system substrate-binding protein